MAWDKNATSYDAIASKVKSSGADAIFLGGIICNNGGKLIKDLRAGVGPDVQILAARTASRRSRPRSRAQVRRPRACTSRSRASRPISSRAKERRSSTSSRPRTARRPNPYTAYAAQAAEVLLASIEDSDGTRASVAEGLFNRDVTDGILGDFKIDENGDTTLGIVSVYQVKGQKETFVKTITPELSFVKG